MGKLFQQLLRPLGSVSSAFNRISGPTWAKTVGAGLLGGGTSIAGSVGNLLFLEGSTPQGADPYDRWRQLGYSSKNDMIQRVSRQLQVPGLPTDYKQTELQAGEAAEAFRPGAGFPGQQAADRAYQAEKSRVAQLSAQDELAKKYNVADLTKAYNTASTPEEKEKIGLQIWATTNPQLAAKLKPGQLGYEETQAVAASQSPLGGAMQAAGNMQFSDKISFGGVPATNFGVDIQTPLTGYTVPNVPQVGITESFKGTTPGGISFTEAAELFKGQLPGQADAAVLKKIFEQGLKK